MLPIQKATQNQRNKKYKTVEVDIKGEKCIKNFVDIDCAITKADCFV